MRQPFLKPVHFLLGFCLSASSVAMADLSNLALSKHHTKDNHLQFPGVASSNGVPQHITLVDNGVAAIKKRLDMIASAKQTIDVQYFIYNVDRVGRLFSQALIQKAQEGAKVRIMVDTSSTVLELNKIFIDELEKQGIDKNGQHNIEIRYYNATNMLQVVSLNYRSHKKVIIIDNKQAVTGGRNMADEYFGLSSEYNFLDMDMFVEGSIVDSMTTDFQDFWDSPIVSDPPKAKAPELQDTGNGILDDQNYEDALKKYKKNLVDAHDFTVQSESDRALLTQIEQQGAKALEQVSYDGICNNLIYAADHPGIGSRDNTRVLTNALISEVKLAAENLKSNQAVPNKMLLESPYFIHNETLIGLVDDLKANNVGLEVMTNSLASTDAFYTVAASSQRIAPILANGAKISIYGGSSAANKFTAEPLSQKATWGTHAKRAVIGNTIMIGTFNIDPRSNNLNAEMALICRDNPEAAIYLRNSIEDRIQHAVALDKKGQPADGRALLFNTNFSKKFLYWLSYPLTAAFGFLL
jgi:putative cardiolipin synthase